MFDFLKGNKVNLTLTLDQAGKTLHFGDAVSGKLVVENEKELKIQEGRIALVFKEESEYRYESRSTDSDGNSETEESTAWQNEEHVAAQTIILREGAIPAKSVKPFDFNFAIPQNAVPTIDGGKIVRGKWLVKATLSRKMASDYNAQEEILVVSVASPRAPSASDLGYSNEPGEAEMALRILGDEWAMGETIEGELIINPQKNFDATEVRVEIVRTEHVSRDKGNTHTEKQTIKLAGGIKLVAGQPLTYPFRIAVPTLRPPTSQTQKFRVGWQLSGILARRFRGDTQVQLDLRVSHVRAS
jgi:hypothetical protein